MKTAQLFAVTAFTALAAFGAHADEADKGAFIVNSSATRAEVSAQARTPVQVNEATTGAFTSKTNSAVSRADVRSQAAMAVRNGTISQGEV